MLPAVILVVTLGVTMAMPTTPVPPNGIRQCARSECPVYEVLEDFGSDMVKRRMQGGLWAYKVAPTCNITQATGSVYMPLHYYFSDNNISRTTPIMMRIDEKRHQLSSCDQSDHHECPCCDQQYTLFFYVPQASRATAPAPSQESGVQLLNVSMSHDFYVISFLGRASYRNATANRKVLVDYLKANNLTFCEKTYFYARYDAPWRPQPHRSEVIVPSVPCESLIDVSGSANNCDEDDDGKDHDGEDHDGDDDDDDNVTDDQNQDQNGDQHDGGHRRRRAVHFLSDVDLIPY